MKMKKGIKDMDLMDDFLFGESMMNEETAVPMAKLIIERATGLKVKNLEITCQKVINGLDAEYHGVRLDVAANEINVKERNAETVRLYDIEPNNGETDDLPRRDRYYQSLMDVKLLETGTDYEKLPELWSIWILPKDPFGGNRMIYTVKNVVEEMPEIEYNDGVRKIFLYTGGEIGGSQELKNLLRYLEDTRRENAVDAELKKLHSGIERLRNSREIGVRYMLELEKAKEKLRRMIDEMEQEITEKVTGEITEKVTEEVTERVTEEVTERVTEEVTERVTEEVTERVTEEVTERVTEEAAEKGVKVLLEACREFGASREAARTQIMEKYGLDLEAAEKRLAKYWDSPIDRNGKQVYN